jgi:hypothetical protein
VSCSDPQASQYLALCAEKYRKEKAIAWLGREMPPWAEPCPLHVKLTSGAAGGATSFNFMHGQVLQVMNIEGDFDQVVQSVLPHEITHTVLAHHFGQPVPRWADEGAAVLEESEAEQQRHVEGNLAALKQGQAYSLSGLFGLKQYPRDVGELYVEGYSVSLFLVATHGRPAFLAFVGQGMAGDWNQAAHNCGYQSVDALEKAWVAFCFKGHPLRDLLNKIRGQQQPATIKPGTIRPPPNSGQQPPPIGNTEQQPPATANPPGDLLRQELAKAQALAQQALDKTGQHAGLLDAVRKDLDAVQSSQSGLVGKIGDLQIGHGQLAGKLPALEQAIASKLPALEAKLPALEAAVAQVVPAIAGNSGLAAWLPLIATGAATGGVGTVAGLAGLAVSLLLRARKAKAAAGTGSAPVQDLQQLLQKLPPVGQTLQGLNPAALQQIIDTIKAHVPGPAATAAPLTTHDSPLTPPESKYVGVPVTTKEHAALLRALDDAAHTYPGMADHVNLIKGLWQQILGTSTKG